MTATIAVAVFARTPVVGSTKTRLIPRLGAHGAAQLQAQLIHKAVARAQTLAPDNTSLWLAGQPVSTVWPREVKVFDQQGADLGARMTHAFQTLLQQHSAVILIGTDCPAQTPQDLHQAAQALHTHELVLQPAEDGGYVLVGLSAQVLTHTPARWPEMFCGIDWGSSAVWKQTQAQLAAMGLGHTEIEMRPDLDVPDDYDRAVRAGWVEAFDGASTALPSPRHPGAGRGPI